MTSGDEKFKALNRGKYGEDREKGNHPSYGQLQFVRTQGGNPNLYGSSIQHQNKIALEIYHSEKNRELNRTWYFPRKQIIRVEMSPTQFAEAITTMGSSPVPVTIIRLGNESIPDCPEENVRQKFSQEFSKKMQQLIDDMKDDFRTAETLLDQKGALKVTERKQIASLLHRIKMEIGSNVPYVHRQFDAAVDKTVTEAKGEIEAFLENKVRSLGLEAAREKGLLPDKPPSLQLNAPSPERTPIIYERKTK